MVTQPAAGRVLRTSVDEQVLKLQRVKVCVHQSSSKHFTVALGTVVLLAILFFRVFCFFSRIHVTLSNRLFKIT